jgi:hypothetical protein
MLAGMRWAIGTGVVLLLAVGWLVFDGARSGTPRIRGETVSAPARASARVYVRRCDSTSSSPAFRSTSRDLVVGPLRVVSFLKVFARAKEDEVYAPGPHGEKALKAALNILGRRDVTIIVPRSERRRLALDYQPGGSNDEVSEGKPAIRFKVCPRGGRATGYPGGWIYSGPWKRCVSLDFKVEGRPKVRRRVPLGAGRCS